MATRPAFQFYPADWRGNANLRRCTEAARGAWIDVLCLLHDSDEYGVLRWPLADIAQAAGLPLKLLQELIRKKVLKGADSQAADYRWAPSHAGKVGDEIVLVAAGDGPCWYCSRFVRDEYIRQRRGANTRFGPSNPPPTKRADTTAGTERARLRAAVLAKTGGHCHHCQASLSGAWEIDHLIPRARGGSNLLNNLVPSCSPCNQDKSDSMPDDWSPPTHQPTHRVGDDKGYGASSSSSTSVKQEQKKKQGAGAPTCPHGVSEQVWADWLALRKAKRAPVTATVLDSATAEAAKAGMTLDAFLSVWCARGSQGLEASWLKPNERAGPANSQQSKTLSAMQTLQGIKHGLAGNRASERADEVALIGPGSDPGE